MSGIGLSYELVVYDCDGNVRERRKEPGHSFTHNFYSMLEALLKDGGTHRGTANSGSSSWPRTVRVAARNTVDDSTAINMSSYHYVDGIRNYGLKPGGFSCNASTGNTDMGIVVGSGTSAATAVVDGITRKRNLGMMIEHGTAPGRVSYDAMRFPAVRTQGSVVTVQLQRLFANDSGSTVTINEIGLFNRCNNMTGWSPGSQTGYNAAYILTIYDSLIDVYPDGLSLENGELLGVTYDIIFNAPD